MLFLIKSTRTAIGLDQIDTAILFSAHLPTPLNLKL